MAAQAASAPPSEPAAPAKKTPLQGVPQTPSAPAPLGKPFQEPRYACKRQLIYEGKTLPCDSYNYRDGEGLRPLLLDVPEAIESLEKYQRNRQSLKWLPYVGTGAIVLAGVGVLLGRSYQGEPWAIPTRNIMAITGVAVLAGAFTYGIVTLTLNERNFDDAIRKHNEAKPEKPIEVRVDATLFF
jgi:hypothetical protein